MDDKDVDFVSKDAGAMSLRVGRRAGELCHGVG